MSYNTNADTLNNLPPSFYGAGQAVPVVSQTADYAASATDCIILMDSTAGAIAVTLPKVAVSGTGKIYYVKKIAGVFPVTVKVTAGGTIDLAPTKVLAAVYDFTQVASDGNNYWII